MIEGVPTTCCVWLGRCQSTNGVPSNIFYALLYWLRRTMDMWRCHLGRQTQTLAVSQHFTTSSSYWFENATTTRNRCDTTTNITNHHQHPEQSFDLWHKRRQLSIDLWCSKRLKLNNWRSSHNDAIHVSLAAMILIFLTLHHRSCCHQQWPFPSGDGFTQD